MFSSRIKRIAFKTAQMANPLMLGFAANLLLIFLHVLKTMVLYRIKLMKKTVISHRLMSFAFSQD